MDDVFTILGIFIAISSPVWLIVLIFMVMKHKTRTAELNAARINNNSSEQVENLLGELAQLKDRVCVLEAIITDSGYQLQEQFKRL